MITEELFKMFIKEFYLKYFNIKAEFEFLVDHRCNKYFYVINAGYLKLAQEGNPEDWSSLLFYQIVDKIYMDFVKPVRNYYKNLWC